MYVNITTCLPVLLLNVNKIIKKMEGMELSKYSIPLCESLKF
jgi:hypothetical protein